MSEQENILKLKAMIEASDNIVFFGGAGVSTESGIPDFRSETGIYNTVHKYGCSPEQILSHTFFMRKPEIFYDFYKSTMVYREAEPNEAHKALAKLEKIGKLKAVVTQNIDGLHQKAGSEKVYELHGTIMKNYCMKCGQFYDLDYVTASEGVPRCEKCGGMVKPDVVLYEEGLDDTTISKSVRAIAEADVLIVGGTSLTVYPAAALLDAYCGQKLALINRDTTPRDDAAALVLRGSIGEILGSIA